MKGRFMEVKMKKRSKKLLEIFSGSATIFNSELSDDQIGIVKNNKYICKNEKETHI